MSFWRKMEQHRKRPWRLAAGLGIWTLLRYLCGRLPLTGALAQLSRRTGCQVQAVLLDDPAAAVDVDTEADWALAQAIIAGRA